MQTTYPDSPESFLPTFSEETVCDAILFHWSVHLSYFSCKTNILLKIVHGNATFMKFNHLFIYIFSISLILWYFTTFFVQFLYSSESNYLGVANRHYLNKKIRPGNLLWNGSCISMPLLYPITPETLIVTTSQSVAIKSLFHFIVLIRW